MTPKELLNRLNEGSSRISLQKRRWDLLNDDCLKHIYTAIEDKWFDSDERADMKTHLDSSYNCYKYFINQLSIVYKEPTKREFALKADTELFHSIIDSADLDNTMERVNQITMACNECFLIPHILEDDSFYFEIIPPHKVEVESWGTNLNALIYKLEDGTFSYWTKEVNIIIDSNGNELSSKPNSQGIIPIIVYRRLKPVEDFWLGTSGEDLVTLYLQQTMYRTFEARIMYNQSFKQLAREPEGGQSEAAGLTIPDQVSSPNSILVGKYNVLNLQTPLTDYHNIVEKQKIDCAASWGISPEVLNQGGRKSGEERKLANASLLEHRKATIKYFRPNDLSLMSLICSLWNARSNRTFTFSRPKINYQEPRFELSELDEERWLDLAMKNNSVSIVDYIMMKDPDLLTREEAISKLEQITSDNAIVLEVRRSFSLPSTLTGSLTDSPSIDQANGLKGGRPQLQESDSDIK